MSTNLYIGFDELGVTAYCEQREVLRLPIRGDLPPHRKDHIARLVIQLFKECVVGSKPEVVYADPSCGIGKES